MPKRHISATRRDHRPLEVGDELRRRFDAIRAEQEVQEQFPPEVLAEAEDVRERARNLPDRDETAVPFITIDPPGSMDLDQALHIEGDDSHEGGGFRVRYAIADVPAFVKPNGPIDRESRRRGQTIYAPDRRTPLHPPVLSEGAASLLPDQVAPAYVWDIRLGADGSVRTGTVYRAMVRSVERFDYETVQRLADGGTAEGTIALLARVGPLRMERELARGGASLPMPEQQVLRDDDGTYSLRFRPPLASEEWNAQISLLTGMVAADIMLRHRVGILRTLPPPTKKTVAMFRRSARAVGVPWRKDVPYGAFLRSLDRTNPMHLALIFEATALFRGSGYTVMRGEVPDQPSHAAVAAPYAHVTAPLRRLVDRFGLLVCAALETGQDVPQWVTDALPTLPDVMTATGRRASAVERAAADAVEAAVLRDDVGRTFPAVVVDRVGPRDDADVVLQVLEPAVIARAEGTARLGTDVTAELAVAEIETSTVRFRLAGRAT
ncbi:RNB domain-containing ribonuclease [Nostocoides sp. F2B08]|uniref:RNB domain-containing ribonuclease n=1 Tax=Nostocoides sp. F2B08 TaxID=2653936 RepID=UPI001262F222|nr:RNB domain-containing ribonuclease [Tetrasphaera sp. F2B08]KAB7744677.1 RNB domain-containing ribonuclease [Tetrasphaera sp. F2B08]